MLKRINNTVLLAVVQQSCLVCFANFLFRKAEAHILAFQQSTTSASPSGTLTNCFAVHMCLSCSEAICVALLSIAIALQPCRLAILLATAAQVQAAHAGANWFAYVPQKGVSVQPGDTCFRIVNAYHKGGL